MSRQIERGQYRIWSIEHNAWWGPAHRGYVKEASKAGIYTHKEAYEICKDANMKALNELMVPSSCYVNDKLRKDGD